MQTRRIAAIAAGATIAVGAGVAIAATRGDEGKKAESAVLADAAKRLNVSPSELRDALAAAEDAQLDQAVKDGKLTQKQADEMKAMRKQSGQVLGFPGPGRIEHGFHKGFGPGPGFGFKPALFEDLASALGLKESELLDQLRDGKKISTIAKAQGKSLDDVKKAVKDAAEKRLDQAVKDGDITEAQKSELLTHLDEHLDRVDDLGGAPRLRGGFPGGPHPKGLLLPGPPFEGLADALGLTRSELLKQLRAGKTISAIAKAHGKSLDDVEKALKAVFEKRLDAAVKRGDLTEAQKKDILEHFEVHLDDLGGPLPFRGERRFRGGPPPGSPPPPFFGP